MADTTKQQEQCRSFGLFLAWQIKERHEELIHQVEHHLAAVDLLLALPAAQCTGLGPDDAAQYARYRVFIDHLLAELEEGR